MITTGIICTVIIFLLVFTRQLGKAQTALWIQETEQGMRILGLWATQKLLPEYALIGLASVNIPAIQQWLLNDGYSMSWAIVGSYAVDVGLYICVKHKTMQAISKFVSIGIGLVLIGALQMYLYPFPTCLLHITFTIFSVSIMVGLTYTRESAMQSVTHSSGQGIGSTAHPHKVTDSEIVEMVGQYGGLTAKEVSQYAFIGHSTAKARLKMLVDKGLLAKDADKYIIV